jgi:hypothetical protein
VILLVTPFSFTANELWAFAELRRVGDAEPVLLTAPARDH